MNVQYDGIESSRRVLASVTAPAAALLLLLMKVYGTWWPYTNTSIDYEGPFAAPKVVVLYGGAATSDPGSCPSNYPVGAPRAICGGCFLKSSSISLHHLHMRMRCHTCPAVMLKTPPPGQLSAVMHHAHVDASKFQPRAPKGIPQSSDTRPSMTIVARVDDGAGQ
jgi:hypothetical protein